MLFAELVGTYRAKAKTSALYFTTVSMVSGSSLPLTEETMAMSMLVTLAFLMVAVFSKVALKARHAKPVMGLLHPVNGKLVLVTATVGEPFADLAIRMERVPQDGKRNPLFLDKTRQSPEIGVQDRVVSGDMQARQSVKGPAEILDIRQRQHHLVPLHRLVRMFRE